MPKFPRISGKELTRLLKSRGFSLVRVHGSHHVLQKNNLRTVIPVHSNKLLKIGTLRGILKDTKISPAEFIKFLRK